MLSRTAKVLGQTARGSENFVDAGRFTSWADESIAFVLELTDPTTDGKIMGGTGNGSFSPNGFYTLEQGNIDCSAAVPLYGVVKNRRRLNKRLISTEPTTVITKAGKKRNGNLMYTILPIEEVIDRCIQRKPDELELATLRAKYAERLCQA